MPIPFYSHFTKGPSATPYACFSQFYRASFAVDGVSFPSSEHYMMWAKAVLFGDNALASQILRAQSAYEAMELGRTVRHFGEELWTASRREIVLTGNLEKFRQNPACLEILLGTGDSILAFASPADLTWGTGLAYREHLDSRATAWPGENLLGQILMEIRTRLREEHAS